MTQQMTKDGACKSFLPIFPHWSALEPIGAHWSPYRAPNVVIVVCMIAMSFACICYVLGFLGHPGLPGATWCFLVMSWLAGCNYFRRI